MRHSIDAESGMAEVAALWSAPTADDLHRVLVLHAPVRHSSDVLEPLALLEKHHRNEPEHSAVTALLLLTDPRWRAGAGQLARRMAESGFVDREHLDLLAESFIAADDAVFWEVPDGWFGDDSGTIELPAASAQPDPDECGTGGGNDDPERTDPTVARRDVPPPLRRWAAGRLVRKDATVWGRVLVRARELDARSAAAVMAGLLDAFDYLPSAAHELLIRTATQWPARNVRKLGYTLVAERRGAGAAHALARNDPDAAIRRWAESDLRSRPDLSPKAGPVPGESPHPDSAATLF